MVPFPYSLFVHATEIGHKPLMSPRCTALRQSPHLERYESPHARAPAFHRYSPESRAQTRLWNQDREVLRFESGSRMFWAAKCEIEFGPQLARKCGFGVSHENLIFLLEHP